MKILFGNTWQRGEGTRNPLRQHMAEQVRRMAAPKSLHVASNERTISLTHLPQLDYAEAVKRLEQLELQLQLLRTQITCEGQSLVSATTMIQQPACLIGAWGEGTESAAERPATADNTLPTTTFPCIAAFVTEGDTFSARVLKRTGLGKEARIKTGSHPFVMLDGEDFLRVGIIKSTFGGASGHPKLGNGQPVLYAGDSLLLVPAKA